MELLAYFLHAPVVSFLEGEDESLVKLDAPPSAQVMALRNRIVGALLHEAREQKGKTQKDLAQAVGCSPRRIAQYERGQKSVPLTQLEACTDYLGMPMS